jgi:hypothetical protein
MVLLYNIINLIELFNKNNLMSRGVEQPGSSLGS